MKNQTNVIAKEYERMCKLVHKGKRLYSDEYIIQSLAHRLGISKEAIKKQIRF